MKKKEPKVSEERKKKIIEYYKQGKTLYEIVGKIYEEEGLDISTKWAAIIINEYCKENNLERKIHRFSNNKKRKTITQMSKEEIREELIKALRDGRPCSKVYEIAQRFEIDIEEELKEYGFYIQKLDEENER